MDLGSNITCQVAPSPAPYMLLRLTYIFFFIPVIYLCSPTTINEAISNVHSIEEVNVWSDILYILESIPCFMAASYKINSIPLYRNVKPKNVLRTCLYDKRSTQLQYLRQKFRLGCMFVMEAYNIWNWSKLRLWPTRGCMFISPTYNFYQVLQTKEASLLQFRSSITKKHENSSLGTELFLVGSMKF